MAYLTIQNVTIKGVATAVPKRVVENSENELFDAEELSRFFDHVGIKRRRCVEEGMTTSDLCFAAAEKLIGDLNWNREEIDGLIFVTQTPDYRNPATSCILQDRLGLSNQCLAFDISLGCSGYVYGLSVAANMLSTGNMRKLLLLVGDTTSLTSSPLDKSRVLLFGDAGTATALEYNPDAPIMQFELGTDGSGFDAIYTPHSGFRNRIKPESFEMVDYGGGIVRAKTHSWLDGLEVFSFGISRAPKSVKGLVSHFNLDINTIDYFLFHQANLMMNEKIRQKLKLETEKVPYNLENYGNTSCASIPLLLVDKLREKAESGRLELLMCAFGVGLSWGSCKVELNEIVCPPVIEI